MSHVNLASDHVKERDYLPNQFPLLCVICLGLYTHLSVLTKKECVIFQYWMDNITKN